ncbi:MAG: DUF4851 domain-containing protein [Desulfovibrionaceae bacterium]|nr:DUF4851 domain-containing protein [Desulfovibrionaceae bacterium]
MKQTYLNYSILFIFLCTLCAACSAAQQRGLHGQNYLSTTRPHLEVVVSNFNLIGSQPINRKLEGMGVTGGLSLQTHLTVYAAQNGAQLIVAHSDLPEGWQWAI